MDRVCQEKRSQGIVKNRAEMQWKSIDRDASALHRASKQRKGIAEFSDAVVMNRYDLICYGKAQKGPALEGVGSDAPWRSQG